MSTPYEIPLTAEAQIFQITLANAKYWLTLHWNTPAGCWLLDIADSAKVPMVHCLPVVCGVDLLGQFAYMKFGGQLIAQTDHALDIPPTLANLGSEGHVYFVVE